MKKLLTLFVTLMCATSIFAYDCQIDGIYYNLRYGNTAEVTYRKNRAKNYSGVVIIPSTITYKGQNYSVTSIGKEAFCNSLGLTSVTIPNSVIRIEDGAFSCTSLTSITIPNSVTAIERYVLSHCLKLTSVTIPNSVTRIEEGAFYGCEKLATISIPNSVTSIGEKAFGWCEKLTSIEIPPSVTYIWKDAFFQCPMLKSVVINSNKIVTGFDKTEIFGEQVQKYIIGDSVTTIDGFKNCSNLKSITISNSVTSIGSFAFSKCSSLTSVNIGNSVTSIGEYAFSDCSRLSSITIPNSATTIGQSAFSDCSSLTSVNIGNSVTTIGEDAFWKCSSLASVTIPNSVTKIESGAFEYCNGLTSITIPNSVTTIEGSAFYGCDNLKKTNYTGTIADWCKIKFEIFANPIYYSNNFFINNVEVKDLVIPEGLDTIGNEAFYHCSSLTSVTIPNSVTMIGEDAFTLCDLQTMTILSTDVKIDEEAFKYCSIDNLYCPKTLAINKNEYIKNIHYLTDDEIIFLTPFSAYAQQYVELHINQWQKKGEFEKVADWQKRVNETTRKQKTNEFLKEAKKKYLSVYATKSRSFTLGAYDTENEVYLVKEKDLGDLLVPIPINEAQYVQQNWENCKTSPKYDIHGTEVVVTSVGFTFPNKKTYTYKPSQNLTYAQADIQYNFDPIELNLGSNTSSPQPKGQQTIQQKQLTIGKSEVDTNIPKTNSVNTKTFVVILANEDYETVASVPFAKNDGNTFKKYCISTLGIPEQNIHLRENATLNNMRSELGWLKQVCEAYKGEASVIFYYAGHGIPDENDKSAYLLPTDGDGRYVQSGYKLDNLYQNLGSMLTKSVTVFMDACFSGSQRGSGMLASARGVALKSKAGVPQGNMVVFSAAQGDETAYPNNEEGHGMFTYYLLKKLQETKGDVTLKDLGDYITTNVSQQSIVINSKSQTPCVTPASAVADSWQNWKLK